MFSRSPLDLLGLILLLSFTTLPAALTAHRTQLLRDPDVGVEHVAFTYMNDIWLALHGGREALRLTSGEGEQADPVFSPTWNGSRSLPRARTTPRSTSFRPEVGDRRDRLSHRCGPRAGLPPAGPILFRSDRESQPTLL